jgi:hypothetical protein
MKASFVDPLLIRSIAGERVRLRAKRTIAPLLGSRPPVEDAPPITILVTNSNNRDPLELTLRSGMRTTRYPRLEVVVGDNDSTDGSREMLADLDLGVPITTIAGARAQDQWYDHLYREVETPYWIGIHEDLVFLAPDWVGDLIARMEADPAVQLVAGEAFPPVPAFAEPVSGEVIDMGESLSTWLFCVRTSLREKLPESSFAFLREEPPFAGKHRLCLDQGGALMRDMRAAGLRYDVMPESYGRKWHHFRNLTWTRDHAMGVHAQYKAWQRRWISRLLQRERSRWSRTRP